jgi:hypothetical protein
MRQCTRSTDEIASAERWIKGASGSLKLHTVRHLAPSPCLRLCSSSFIQCLLQPPDSFILPTLVLAMDLGLTRGQEAAHSEPFSVRAS